MSERVLTETVEQLLARHKARVGIQPCECFRCRSLRDLLDARQAIAWITGTDNVESVIAGATAARAATENGK